MIPEIDLVIFQILMVSISIPYLLGIQIRLGLCQKLTIFQHSDDLPCV